MQTERGKKNRERYVKNQKLLLLLRLIRRAHVLMAQISQHLPVFFAHSARKVWIVQVPVARGLRHVLQDAQPLLNRPLPVRRQLLPLRHHVIFDVVSLLGRKLLPILSSSFHILLSLRRQLIELPLIVRQAATLLRSHIPPTFLHIRWRRCRRLPIGILWPIVPVTSAVVIRAWVRVSARTTVVRAAAVLIRGLPTLTAARSLRMIRTRRPIVSLRRLLLPRRGPVVRRAVLRIRTRH